MTTTHDYRTIVVTADGLDNTCVLVGESGGLSAVYHSEYNEEGTQLIIETEHCTFLADSDMEFIILAEANN